MKRQTRQGWLWVCTVVIAVFGCAQTIHAAATPNPLKLTATPADKVVVRGQWDGKTSTFSGYVRLTFEGTASAGMRVLSSDLQQVENGSAQISRVDVSIPADTRLTGGQPTDVLITLNNVKKFGNYRGTLELTAAIDEVAASQAPTQSKAITLLLPIELNLQAAPNVQPMDANLSVQVVNCQNTLECWLATRLLPEALTNDDWTVYVENTAPVSATVAEGMAVMRSAKTGASIQSEIIIAPGQIISSGLTTPLHFSIARARLAADRYQGSLRLKINGVEQPVVVNTTIEVRNGPGWAIIVIFLGILVGRLVRARETPQGQKQEKFFPRIRALEEKAEPLKDEDAKVYVKGQINSARAKVASPQVDEAAAEALLTALDKAIGDLIWLEEAGQIFNDKIAGESDAAEKLTLQSQSAQIGNAREFIIQGDPDSAEKLMANIKRDLGLQAPAKRGAIVVTPPDAVPVSTITPQQSMFIDGLKRVIAALISFLTGTNPLTVERQFWWIKGLLFTVLLVLLGLLGLQTLYVNSGVTFGVNRIYDYLGLFLWGLSAEVAQRTLQTLQMPAPAADAKVDGQ